MKNKMISSTILHIVLFIVVCFICLFSVFKIYTFILNDSIHEEEKKYITVKTDEYIVECLDYYFNEKFFYDGVTHGVYSPNTHLILRLRITNTSNDNITLSNDYKLTYGDKTENLKYAFNKYRVNIEPGKNVVSDVAYLIQYDQNIKKYYVNFDGEIMALNFEVKK